MGFRIRKSINLGKYMRLNLGKSGVTSASFGKRGAPHVTVGKDGARFGTPVIPGTGVSYETTLGQPKKSKTTKKPGRHLRKDSQGQETVREQEQTIMAGQQFPKSQWTAPSSGPQPVPPTAQTMQSAVPPQTQIIPPAGTPSLAGPAIPPAGNGNANNGAGGNGGNDGSGMPKKKSWGRRILKIVAFFAVFILGFAIGQTPVDPTTSSQYKNLQQQLTSEQAKNKDVQDQLDQLNDKVGDLDSLKTQLDKEKAELDKQKSDQDKRQQEQDDRQTQLDEREKNIAQKEEEKKEREQAAIQAAEQQRQQQAQAQAQQQTQAAQQPSSGGSGSLVAICADGSRSVSAPGASDYRGMCSHHGGISSKLGRQ